MKHTPGVLFLIFVIGLQTAAAQYVYRDLDTDVSLAQYKSFALVVADLFEAVSERETNFNKLAAKAVEHQLARRRLNRQSLESADLLIACYVFSRDRRHPLRLGYDESRLSIHSDIRRWQMEGNIIVDLVDSKTNHVVWRGVAMRALTRPEQPEQQIERAVSRLFNKYPASRRGFETNLWKRQLLGLAFAVGVMTAIRLAAR